MSYRRVAWFAILVLAMSLALSACVAPTAATAPAPSGESASTEAAASASGEPVTLTWAIWGEPSELTTHQKVADAYMAANPNIKVEIWNQPWSDYFTKIQALWASGDTKLIPDIAFLWPTPKYAAEGVLANLDSYIKQDGVDLNDYWAGLLDSSSYNGSVYGLPRDTEVNVLYYNKDLFDKAGQAYPTDEWTWDDLLAAADKLTVKDDSGKTTQYALAMESGKWPKWVMQAGGSALDDLVNPSKCTLTDEASVRGLQFFSDLVSKGYLMPPADLGQAGGDAGVFQSGQAAMIIQNTSRVSGFNAANMNYDVAPVPFPADGKRWNGAGGAAWVMSEGSDAKPEAWAFLKWLQSADGGQKIYTESGEIFPALQSVANSPAFLTDAPPANKQGIITEASASGTGGFGYFPESDEIFSTIIGAGVDKILAGESDATSGAAAICDQVNAFLADNGYPKQ